MFEMRKKTKAVAQNEKQINVLARQKDSKGLEDKTIGLTNSLPQKEGQGLEGQSIGWTILFCHTKDGNLYLA